MTDFRWNDWNYEHATRHGVSISEIESVVRHARRPWPKYIGNGKWRTEGRGQGDRIIRVIYIVDLDDTLYVIHAMPLSTRRKRRRR